MGLQPVQWSDPFKAKNRGASLQVARLRLSELQGGASKLLSPLTTADERSQSQRYRFETDRIRHLAGRALIRALLTLRFTCSPQNIPIAKGPNGKPFLKGETRFQETYEFNIAHAQNVVMVALSLHWPVGIDVEPLSRGKDVVALAEQVLTRSERKRWEALPKPKQDRFFIHIWTCKEAFLKATGEGLSRPPKTVECSFCENAVEGIGGAENTPETSSTSPSKQEGQKDFWAVGSFMATDGMAAAFVRKQNLPPSVSFIDGIPLIRHFSLTSRSDPAYPVSF